MLYRASDADELLFRGELEQIARSRGASLYYLLGRSSDGGGAHLSPKQLRELVPDLTERDVFLCGPAGMTEHARRSLRQAGVARRQIHEESFVF